MYNIAIQDGSRVNMYLILCSVFWRMPISDRYTPKVLFDTYFCIQDEHNQGEFFRRQGTVLPWGLSKEEILKLAAIKIDDLPVRMLLDNGKFNFKIKIKAYK